MNEVAAWAIGTIAKVVEGSAGLCLVLGVTVQTTQFCLSMGKLALTAVLATASLLKATAQLSFVTVR